MASHGIRPLKVGVKWCEQPKLGVPRAQGAPRPYLGPFFGHFEPFLTLFGPSGGAAMARHGLRPPKVGVKLGGKSKLVGPEGPSGA